MAPEVVRGMDYECEVDIWSTGVIAYIMLSGDAPFRGNNKAEIQREILNKPIMLEGQPW